MKKGKRFVTEIRQGNALNTFYQVIVDRETGVNYLFVASGYAGGLSPLLDRDGKPVISEDIASDYGT